MAKRKAARTSRRPSSTKKAAGKRGAGGRRKARPAKRTAKTVRKAARRRTGAVARKAATGPGSSRAAARKATGGKAKATARARARSAPATKTKAAKGRTAAVPRKAPALNRERRIVTDDEDIVQSTPPSSLDLDRSASAVRTGRRSLRNRFKEHTETSPALTGGDVDADWESAYTVGDEAPGGDNPTPDQDIVDDIGRAVGIEYQDNEELKGADKVEKRDKKRWELDPASSEDWDER